LHFTAFSLRPTATSTALDFDRTHSASIASHSSTYPTTYPLHTSRLPNTRDPIPHTTYSVCTALHFRAISFALWLGFVLCVPFSSCLAHQRQLRCPGNLAPPSDIHNNFSNSDQGKVPQTKEQCHSDVYSRPVHQVAQISIRPLRSANY
jgi:hypothetical protein